jgi:hypothetical protein
MIEITVLNIFEVAVLYLLLIGPSPRADIPLQVGYIKIKIDEQFWLGEKFIDDVEHPGKQCILIGLQIVTGKYQ